MAKTPSLTQQLWSWTENRAFSTAKHSLVTDLARDLFQVSSQWLHQLNRIHNGNAAGTVICVGAIALFVWNWQLLIALIFGLGVTLLAVQGLPRHSTKQLKVLLMSPTTLAIGLGLASVVISYSTLLIWQDTGRLGIALAVLLQAVCTLSALGLLAWQLLKPSSEKDRHNNSNYETWVNQLIAPQPLHRLIAVRNLSKIEVLPIQRRQELSEYFQLLLAQETQPQVREAVLVALKQLDASSMDRSRKQPPRQQALQLKRRIKVRKERLYAELEAEESWAQS